MDDITKILVFALMVVFFILCILVLVLVYIKVKAKNSEKENKAEKDLEDKTSKSKVSQNYDEKSIFDFMEFDKIEDNMIVQKNGRRYLMIIKCKGINYDLMSEIEKNSVEQGFLQYLNTLRHQIQIYVQTSTVNLENSINTYKNQIRELEEKLNKEELEYNRMQRDETISEEELAKQYREVVKAKNLYEYGVDIVNNTERMSLNKNILSKQYYVIIPYYTEELGAGEYSKEEKQSMAFSELYTRAQSTINLLSVCGVEGKILDSIELSNLLYMAYNRDEAEMYGLQKAIDARYDEMYTTAPNVLDKRIRILDRQIEKEAYERANQAITEVRQESERERMVKEREENYEDAIRTLAKMILERNKRTVGIKTAEKAKEKIDKEDSNETKSKEVEQNEEKQKITRRPGRPRKVK
jgi:hypothetical protein